MWLFKLLSLYKWNYLIGNCTLTNFNITYVMSSRHGQQKSQTYNYKMDISSYNGSSLPFTLWKDLIIILVIQKPISKLHDNHCYCLQNK